MDKPETSDLEQIARGLVNLIPERTKRIIAASSTDVKTSGAIAASAGLPSGASIVAVLRDAGFHDRVWGGNQFLWRLNALGVLVSAFLGERRGRPVKPATCGPEPYPRDHLLSTDSQST